MSRDADELRAFLAHIGRRRLWLCAAEGAAGGLCVAIVLVLAGWPAAGATGTALLAGLCLGAVGVAARVLWMARHDDGVAQLVERRAPQCRNVVITAHELMSRRTTGSEYVTSLVWHDAARTVRALDASTLLPGGRAVALLVASAVLWSVALARPSIPALASVSPFTHGGAGTAAAIERIDVTITPPAYANQPPQTLRDPSHIDALAGSRIHLAVRANGQSVALETISGVQPLASLSERVFTGDVRADGDGYIGLRAVLPNGSGTARTLIGLTVTPDNAPVVRITAPGRDTTLLDPHATIDVHANASDDIGLSSLRLRYTRVSGSGERYTFVEGEVPLDIVRRDTRSWTAHVRWSLDTLSLTPGDMVVYRVVATDRRPGAPESESDAFIAELAAPGGNAAAGFALDPDEQRYAVSQQMVILESERLLARKPHMSAAAYTEASQDIDAEQRKVRAEFVFMMGGEVADAPGPDGDMTSLNETAEANGESDLAAGRMFNRGRVALQTAIRSMSRASAFLTTADVAAALPHEREALTQLEAAFSRTRIILRALTEHERLDLTRRLSGTLTDVTRDVHPSADPAVDPTVAALRTALAGVASLAGEREFDASAPERASALAEDVLQVGAADPSLQAVVTLLDSAATVFGGGRAAAARDLLDRGASDLATVLRHRLVDAPAAGTRLRGSALDGSLTDALRAGDGAGDPARRASPGGGP